VREDKNMIYSATHKVYTEYCNATTASSGRKCSIAEKISLSRDDEMQQTSDLE
jgi:hypothetical protein